MIPTPILYRWDVYGDRKRPGPWHWVTAGKLRRAIRALRMPNERLRVRLDNGQEIVIRAKFPLR
jgi:hypothetical protein